MREQDHRDQWIFQRLRHDRMETGLLLRSGAIIGQMTKLHQFAIMCAPTNSQYAAVEGLRNCEDEVEEMRKSYNQRRRFLMHEFDTDGAGVL